MAATGKGFMAGAGKGKFVFEAKNLCLDFVNTKILRNGELTNLLRSFDDLLSWLIQAGVIATDEAEQLSKRWDGKRQSSEALDRAWELRTSLHRMAERLSTGKAAQPEAVALINELLRHQAGYTELKKKKGVFEKEYKAQFSDPIQLLVPIAQSAADLLCYGDPNLIKKCESDSCVLFFYDASKNHSRRWCSMTACGNREKVAAHYRRQRAAQTGGENK